MSTQPQDREPITTQPIYALLALVVFVGALLTLYLTGRDSGAGLFIALAVSTLPSLVASLAAERAARDIRNGTLRKKVKEGTLQAIDESGVMLRTGPVANAQLEALTVILRDVHSLAASNAAAVQDVRAAVADQDARAVANSEPNSEPNSG